MGLFAEPVPTSLTLPTGPVTADFRASLERALDGLLPAGKSGALVGVATERGLIVGVAAKLGKGWRVGGELEKTWGGSVTGRVMVMGAW